MSDIHELELKSPEEEIEQLQERLDNYGGFLVWHEQDLTKARAEREDAERKKSKLDEKLVDEKAELALLKKLVAEKEADIARGVREIEKLTNRVASLKSNESQKEHQVALTKSTIADMELDLHLKITKQKLGFSKASAFVEIAKNDHENDEERLIDAFFNVIGLEDEPIHQRYIKSLFDSEIPEMQALLEYAYPRGVDDALEGLRPPVARCLGKFWQTRCIIFLGLEFDIYVDEDGPDPVEAFQAFQKPVDLDNPWANDALYY